MSQALQAITNILLVLLLATLVLLYQRFDGLTEFVGCGTDPNVTSYEAQAGFDHCRRYLNQGQLP